MVIYFMATWTFWISYDHLVHFLFIVYIFSGFGIMHQEKSGNPGVDAVLPTWIAVNSLLVAEELLKNAQTAEVFADLHLQEPQTYARIVRIQWILGPILRLRFTTPALQIFYNATNGLARFKVKIIFSPI
jgi:hypothetical protein